MGGTNSKLDLKQCHQLGPTCAVFNLRKAARAVTQRYEEIMKPSGLLPTQFTLLMAICALGPVTISRLAEALLMDRTTLTRNLKPLERDGLLEVMPGKDQRSREARLTEQGRRQLEQALPLWRQAQNRMRRAFGAKRLEGLLGDLTDIATVARQG